MLEFALIFRRTAPVNPADLASRNAAARDWALALARRGLLRRAAPLQDGGRIVSARGTRLVPDTDSIASVLVVAAESLDAATSLAAGHPGLAFGVELEVRPVAPVVLSQAAARELVYFVDRFSVPRASIDEFKTQATYNRGFVATLPGYLRGDAFERVDDEGNLNLVTIAVWESEARLDEAKRAVQSEFARIGFSAADFYRRLHVRVEREQYRGHQG